MPLSPRHASAHAIRSQVLECASPEVTGRLLEHWSYSLKHLGITPPARDPESLRQFCRQLSSTDGAETLLNALVDMHAVATDAGTRALVAVLRVQRSQVFTTNANLSGPDWSITAYLDEPSAFRAARTLVTSQERKRFFEFYPEHPAPLTAAKVEAAAPSVMQELSAWFAAHGRTHACWMDVAQAGDEIVVSVVHGNPRKSVTTIEDDGERGRSTFVPDREDVILFCPRTGGMSIHAERLNVTAKYREAWSQHLHGRPDCLREVEVYSGRPLTERGVKALAPAGVQGLRSVSLKELQLVSPQDGAKVVITHRVDNLGLALQRSVYRELLQESEIASLKLLFRTEQKPHGFVVEICPPNRLKYDRRFTSTVREFLVRQQFAHYPQVTRENQQL